MSNPFKSIGKVFKKIGKVVKKIALPALAIGAAVLTGGAALGILPALGGAGSLIASPVLASIISSAGTGALIGGGTSLLTGKSFMKGMVTGGLVGAATGGIGQLVKGAGAAASVAKSAGTVDGAITVTKGAADIGGFANGVANAADDIVVTGARGINALSGAGNIASAAAPTVTQDIQQPLQPAPKPAPAQNAGGSPATQGRGIGSFLSGQPYVIPGVLQGIGSAITAKAEAGSRREAIEAEAARIRENYGQGISYFTGPGSVTRPVQQVTPQKRWKVDPKTGEVYQEEVPQ